MKVSRTEMGREIVFIAAAHGSTMAIQTFEFERSDATVGLCWTTLFHPLRFHVDIFGCVV